MSTYRLTKPLIGFLAGSRQVVTIPTGSYIEKDYFLASVGLTSVFWGGKRLSVMILDLADRCELVDKWPETGEDTRTAA
jgi:hypothetical protein